MLLVAALVDAVRRHVTDRNVLDAIGREVEQLVAVDALGGDRSPHPATATGHHHPKMIVERQRLLIPEANYLRA